MFVQKLANDPQHATISGVVTKSRLKSNWKRKLRP